MSTLSANPFNLLQVNLHNPFVKVLLPLVGLIVVLLLARFKYHFSYREDLQCKRPRVADLLLWVSAALLWMLGTDYFMNWRGSFDFKPWFDQPLHVSILRVLAVCFLGPVLEELLFRGL